jgi:hypothetical protein
MSQITHLRQIVLKQHIALGEAGSLLGTIGQGKSRYADEAWAVFSRVFNVCAEVKALVDADLASPSHGREGAE